MQRGAAQLPVRAAQLPPGGWAGGPRGPTGPWLLLCGVDPVLGPGSFHFLRDLSAEVVRDPLAEMVRDPSAEMAPRSLIFPHGIASSRVHARGRSLSTGHVSHRTCAEVLTLRPSLPPLAGRRRKELFAFLYAKCEEVIGQGARWLPSEGHCV